MSNAEMPRWLQTPLCQLLGIEWPVIQGGMVHVATWELASAVSNAGGLGTIGCGAETGEWLAAQIERLREATDKPFAVNLLLLSPHYRDCVNVALEKRVPVVTFGAGIPRREIPAFVEAGIRVLPLSGSPRLARIYERLGATGVIAEGLEAGGEIGEMTTLTLVPLTVSATKLPVVAAGGIGDGRGLAAALALGAQAVQLGTRFVATQECIAHPAMKAELVRCGERETVVCGYQTGNPVRALNNALTDEMTRRDKEVAGIEDPAERKRALESMIQWAVGASKRGLIDGDIEFGSLLAGQISAMIEDLPSAGEVVRRLVREAGEVLTRLAPKGMC